MTKYQKPSFAVPKICKLDQPVSMSYIWQSDFAVNRLGNSYVAKISIIKKENPRKINDDDDDEQAV